MPIDPALLARLAQHEPTAEEVAAIVAERAATIAALPEPAPLTDEELAVQQATIAAYIEDPA